MSPATHTRREFLGRAAAGGALVGLTGCLGLGPSPSEQVDRRREELSRLEDVSTAISEGYQTAGRYVRTDDGVLGTPFVNPDVDALDETAPNMVLYDLTNEGQYRPLGVKWYVPASERDGPPTLFGRTFDGPTSSPLPFVPEHYALTVWLFRENPDGLFAPYNGAVDPAPLVDELEPVRDALRPYLNGGNAEEQGFRNTEKCIADEGGYGVPFVPADGDGRGGTEPTEPPVLLYRITSNWNYLLNGAEWYVPVESTDSPPTMFGQEFHGPTAGHSPKTNQPEHYGLHAWLFYANPDGMFEPYNPVVRC